MSEVEKDLHMNMLEIIKKLKAPKNQNNSFGRYMYRSCEDILEAVKPLLIGCNVRLSLSDEMIGVNDRIYVKATASVTDGDQTFSTTAFAREPLTKKGMDEAQITGSASSYSRKYALNGLFCIDDNKDADTDSYNKVEKKLDNGVKKLDNLTTDIKEVFNGEIKESVKLLIGEIHDIINKNKEANQAPTPDQIKKVGLFNAITKGIASGTEPTPNTYKSLDSIKAALAI